jgi:hypothetical protein
MNLDLLNQRLDSTPIDQFGGDHDVPLRKERIEAAFGDLGTGTEVTTSDLGTARKTQSSAEHTPPRGIRFAAPRAKHRLMGFVTEQRWQGYVTNVEGEKFHAQVYDTSPEYKDEIEEVEFEREEVAELMRDLIVPGAIFFWDIGFQVEASGQRLRQSIVSFPMIPFYTKKQRLEAKERAMARFKELGWGQRGKNAAHQSEDSA